MKQGQVDKMFKQVVRSFIRLLRMACVERPERLANWGKKNVKDEYNSTDHSQGQHCKARLDGRGGRGGKRERERGGRVADREREKGYELTMRKFNV